MTPAPIVAPPKTGTRTTTSLRCWCRRCCSTPFEPRCGGCSKPPISRTSKRSLASDVPPRGSLSESVTIFDSGLVKRIAEQVATRMPSAKPSRFDVIGKQLTAFGGSVFKNAIRVANLAWLPSEGGGATKGFLVDGYRGKNGFVGNCNKAGRRFLFTEFH